MRGCGKVLQVCWLSLAALMAAAPQARADSEPVRVIHFSPQGTVKGIRQVTARFSAPMVAFGDPRSGIDPFEIRCAQPGAGCWIDSRTWSYDFTRDLPAGLRCRFTLRDNLRSLERAPVAGERRFVFSTGGPAIVDSVPAESGLEWPIDEDQAFVVTLDAEATTASVLAHASFAVEGLRESIGVKVLTGKDRDAILKTMGKDAVSAPTLVLQARRRFPNDATVSLVWGKGIAAASGVATEQDQRLQFKTRKVFTAYLHCSRENRRSDCIPIAPMAVRFSNAVAWEQARRIVLVGAEGKRWTPKEPRYGEGFVTSVDILGPFPEEATLQLEMPSDIRDDAGRALLNADKFPLTVKTADFPPLAKFASRFGIVEWKADPVLPVTLRNLDPEVQAQLFRVADERAPGASKTMQTRVGQQLQANVKRVSAADDILPWLRRVARAKRTQSVFTQEGEPRPTVESFNLPKPNGAKAFEVVGIPFKAPGLYVVELASPRLGSSLLGAEQSLYVPTAALVTNLSVHFKWGHENSLVWVTTLDFARPVADAEVALHDCRGSVLWRGSTNREGIARIDVGLPADHGLPQCPVPHATYDANEYFDHEQSQMEWALQSGLLVTAQTRDDLGFVHSSWNKGIEPWRFQLSGSWGSDSDAVVMQTIFDRPLFRAGETVHMKHVLRRKTLHGFEMPATSPPSRISIGHIGSNTEYGLALQWDDKGVAESTWTIPKEAKLGHYEVQVSLPSSTPWLRQRSSGEFQVEQFRIPLMQGTVGLPTEPQVGITEMPVDLGLNYLAGGGAANSKVTLGIAPTVRAGDQFSPEFTVRNITERAMDVAVNATVAGLKPALSPQSVHLAAGEAKVVAWDITAPAGVGELRYEVTASETGGARDQLRVTQHVIPAVPVRTFQATLLRGDKPVRQPVAPPPDAVAGSGGVQVTLAPTLTQGLNGVRDWMRDYAYTCLEQRVSRAVALKDPGLWDAIAAALPSHMDADGLLKYFPAMAQGSDVLTAYVLSITHEAGLVIPSDAQRRLEEGLRKFIAGSISRDSELRTADLSIRKLAAVDALARVGQAHAALLGSVTIEPNLWPTSALLDWWDILVRVNGIADQVKRLTEVEQILRARLNLQGTTMGFSTERADTLWWLMAGPDTNALRLILHLLQAESWREDLPRLMQGALARQDKGTWCCTTSNAWGMLAVDKFSAVFEEVAVDGHTTAALATTTQGVDWSQNPAGTSFLLPWPGAPASLAIDHAGAGAPWLTLQARAAIPLKKPLSSGYRIKRTVTPIEPRVPDRYSRGDLLRVRLEVEAQSDMTWVVVNDPIPAGASHLGSGLKRQSTVAAPNGPNTDSLTPVFEEHAFDAYRAYYPYVPKGSFVTEYTIRLNQTGSLQMPTTRVEALYAPEMFGELPNAPVEVQP